MKALEHSRAAFLRNKRPKEHPWISKRSMYRGTEWMSLYQWCSLRKSNYSSSKMSLVQESTFYIPEMLHEHRFCPAPASGFSCFQQFSKYNYCWPIPPLNALDDNWGTGSIIQCWQVCGKTIQVFLKLDNFKVCKLQLPFISRSNVSYLLTYFPSFHCNLAFCNLRKIYSAS